MAEALATFGGAAAAVQLLDVAIRISDDIYTFFRTARKAEEDVQTHLSSKRPLRYEKSCS